MSRARVALAAAMVLTVVAVGLVPAGVAGRSKRTPCRPDKGAEVVQANTRAILVRGPRESGSRDYFACARSAGRMVYLGGVSSDLAGGTGLVFRLGGTYVARLKTIADGRESASAETLSVVDLRARNGGSGPSFSGSTRGDVRSQVIDTFVMAPNGVAAFSAVTDGAPDQVELIALSRRGPVTLDAGPDLAPSSLALAGRRLYWTKGGVPRSAELGAVPSSGP